jgi:hypothetical protein
MDNQGVLVHGPSFECGGHVREDGVGRRRHSVRHSVRMGVRTVPAPANTPVVS